MFSMLTGGRYGSLTLFLGSPLGVQGEPGNAVNGGKTSEFKLCG